jgi:hypothetical protein
MISKIIRIKSLAHYALAASMLAAVACESATSPISNDARSSSESAEFAKSSTAYATSIKISAASVSAGQPVTVNATLYSQGHPLTGKKMWLSVDGGTATAAVGSKIGTATWTVNGLAVGTHTLSVSYAGEQNWLGSSANATVTVNP